jgi:hypothetical protein
MALTKIPRGLLDTGIADSSDATAITIDSSENVKINQKLSIGTTSTEGALNLSTNTNLTWGTDYSAIGSLKNSQGLLLGNNIKAGASNNTVVRHANGTDAGTFIKLAYNKGVTFHTGIATTLDAEVSEDSNERMRIDATGKVGIGATSFTGANPLVGATWNTADYVMQLENSAAAGSSHGLRILAGGNSSDAVFSLRDRTNSNQLFFVTGEGKVGIGTASPAAALHIEVADNTEFLKATITGNEAWAFKGASGSGATDYVSFGISGGTQAMAWQEDGKVGIGTTAPARALSTKSSSVTVGSFESTSASGGMIGFVDSNTTDDVHVRVGALGDNLVLQAGGATRMTIDSAGKVSIASTSTAAQLNVYESSNSQMQFQTSATGTGSSNGVRFGYNGSGAQIWNFQNNYVRFATNNVERVRINNLGYLGINFTNPLYPLDSTGTGEIQARFKSTGDTGYTQGAILIESSDSTSSPQDRGQGVYMFNHGSDKTWYMGTNYGNSSSEFQIAVVGGSTLQKSAAADGTSAAMQINASRQITMGSTSHADDVLYLQRSNAGKLLRFYQGASETGYIGTTSGTTSLPSDRNFKKDINDLNLGLDFVKSLNPKTFRLKIEENDTPLSTGLIAQEIEESLTEAGITKNSLAFIQHKPNEDAEQSQYWINNESIIPILINAIQELSAKLEAK